MDIRRRRVTLAFVATVAVLLAAITTGTVNVPKSPTDTVTTPTTVSTCSVKAINAHLRKAGFEKGSYRIVTDNFKPKKSAEVFDNGAGAFSAEPVLTTAQLDKLLSATESKTALASSIVKKRLNGRSVNWVAVSFNKPVHIKGNLGVNGAVVVQLGTRKSASGDIVWLPVDPTKCQVVVGVVIRAGCGNPAKAVVPVPKPPVRHPRPCPKGQNKNANGVCVKPKSSNPTEYKYPVGKTPVPKVTTSPEAKPPVVETTHTGGNAVVDTPAKAPGTETGGTAPGATPAPTKSATPPPNEGGSNNGSVGSF